ncbi:lipocalin family protein [Rosenbergiella australiborealis]|uniref:lipocalin family protein n=1 Tax=Rosenbergiella australiborealis TaxID=1544696 RepID=UPI001F4EC4A6|nr:lipocalin family protein [Rosenbergiella australiborealis]
MKKKLLFPLVGLGSVMLLAACQNLTPPKGIKPVTGFTIQKYQGKWFEVARLENRFEKGLTHVTATYQLQQDGTVTVINRGFNPKKGQWSESVGKAKFTGSQDRAALKVSFFGPFYASYNVIALDDDYQTALVCGPDRSYLWILSRQPHLTPAKRQMLLTKAKQAGFAIDQLLWTDQE